MATMTAQHRDVEYRRQQREMERRNADQSMLAILLFSHAIFLPLVAGYFSVLPQMSGEELAATIICWVFAVLTAFAGMINTFSHEYGKKAAIMTVVSGLLGIAVLALMYCAITV